MSDAPVRASCTAWMERSHRLEVYPRPGHGSHDDVRTFRSRIRSNDKLSSLSLRSRPRPVRISSTKDEHALRQGGKSSNFVPGFVPSNSPRHSANNFSSGPSSFAVAAPASPTMAYRSAGRWPRTCPSVLRLTHYRKDRRHEVFLSVDLQGNRKVALRISETKTQTRGNRGDRGRPQWTESSWSD